MSSIFPNTNYYNSLNTNDFNATSYDTNTTTHNLRRTEVVTQPYMETSQSLPAITQDEAATLTGMVANRRALFEKYSPKKSINVIKSEDSSRLSKGQLKNANLSTAEPVSVVNPQVAKDSVPYLFAKSYNKQNIETGNL